MQRKRKDDRQAWGYRVYHYGVRLFGQSTPPQWPESLRQVVFAQRDLWNACQAAWEKNRQGYEALMAQAEAIEPLRDAKAQALENVTTWTRTIKQARQRARSRAYAGHAAETQAHEQAKAVLAAASAQLKMAEAAHRLAIKPQLTALLNTLWQEVHTLGQASPLAWYNERQVTDSFRNCVERFLKRQGGPPQPKRRLTTAHLTYHFTGPPLTWEQLLMGKSAMITFGDQREVLPFPEEIWAQRLPGTSRRAYQTTGHLRISDTHTLSFYVTLHRRPPEGSLIKGVELVGRETLRPFAGYPGRWTWMFYVLCEIPPRDLVSEEKLARAPLLKQAALDLNWRILDDDRIRIGMVYDGTRHTPLYFPAPLVKTWRFAQDLQNDIAAYLERCKATLAEVWQHTPVPPDVDPRGAGWVQTGQGGLLRLLRAVEALPQALPSRQPTLDVLTWWARRTGKLWREWRLLTGRLGRATAAWYAVTAKQLCLRYRHLAVEDLDLRQMSQQEDQAPRLDRSQKYRQLVGLAAFLQRLRHTAQREGVTVMMVDAAYTTLTCPQCGTVLDTEANTGDIFLHCPHGCVYDQDMGAAQEVFRRAFAAPAASGVPC